MKFKLYVAVEQHHIDADGKPLSEPWDLFVEPWQYTRILQRPDLAGDMGWRKKAIVRLYVGPASRFDRHHPVCWYRFLAVERLLCRLPRSSERIL